MKHLDIKEGQSNNTSPTAKNYFWPVAFGFPMRDPYYTGPMSQPVLSPAGGIVMPRRNPYFTRPANPMLNPYNAQYRQTIWPMAQSMPRAGTVNTCPHHGPFCPNPRSNGFMPSIGMPPRGMINPSGMPPRGPRGPMGPYGPMPPRGPMGPMGPLGPVGMPPMGPPPMGMPPMGPRPF